MPEIMLTGWALVLLIVGGLTKGSTSFKVSGILSVIGTACALYFAVNLWGTNLDIFNQLYTIDDYGTFFKVLFLAILMLVSIISMRYADREGIGSGEYYSLLMFGVLGMMVMTSSHHFITIFIGLEVMSLSIYVLCGLLRNNMASVEASLKYFLLGAFATAFLLYGMAMVYGSTGLMDVVELKKYFLAKQPFSATMFVIGMGFLVVGFGFKIASVPFHMWTPDVYQGAPTSITAYMATGVKAAAFGALIRVFFTAFIPFHFGWSEIIWVLAVLTMCVGNITALAQRDVKRMLAYSSIAHAGYILVAFITGDRALASSMLYYLMAYSFMNIGAFTVVIILAKTGDTGSDIDSYAGLGVRHPFVALCMSVFLLSLAGVPPLAGFMGKFYVFSTAVKAEFYWLAIIGFLNSVVAAYYYLRVMMYMYFRETIGEPGAVDKAPQYGIVMVICIGALLYMGIFPKAFVLIAQKAVGIFS
ncbi:MAG: NADH-quinone oxidoreductase subunit N [Syntrophorhabdaceae bacterium]|nr:NADH-quinone oxidoreductase subunit N [Syntrophorhabdaceae bacterium]